MSNAPYNATSDYQPETVIKLPVLYAWPPKPLALIRYLFIDLLLPWGYLLIGLAFFNWQFLTPAMSTMQNLEFGWVAMIWLRNAALLTLVAGGLHWWLYMRRGQGIEYKFINRWMDTDNRKFLWGNQVWDNMFWCYVSGVTFWTIYESLTFWMYANQVISAPNFVDHPLYILLSIYLAIFLGTVFFYVIHRLSHWPPLYKISHELHHRNVNVGPWTGIAMHPIEHALYFGVFTVFWIVPIHPIAILFLGLFFGVSPAISHSGFDFIKVKSLRFSTGDWFHQLHHQYFDLNYGNTPSPLDWIFGTWHNGSKDSLMAQKAKRREARKARATRQIKKNF